MAGRIHSEVSGYQGSDEGRRVSVVYGRAGRNDTTRDREIATVARKVIESSRVRIGYCPHEAFFVFLPASIFPSYYLRNKRAEMEKFLLAAARIAVNRHLPTVDKPIEVISIIFLPYLKNMSAEKIAKYKGFVPASSGYYHFYAFRALQSAFNIQRSIASALILRFYSPLFGLLFGARKITEGQYSDIIKPLLGMIGAKEEVEKVRQAEKITISGDYDAVFNFIRRTRNDYGLG